MKDINFTKSLRKVIMLLAFVMCYKFSFANSNKDVVEKKVNTTCHDTTASVIQTLHPCCSNSNFTDCIDLANNFFNSLPDPPVTVATINTYQNLDTTITEYTRMSQQGCTYNFICKVINIVILNQAVVNRTQNATCDLSNNGQVDIQLNTFGDISCVWNGTYIIGYNCTVYNNLGNAVANQFSQLPTTFLFTNLLPGQYTAVVSGGCGSYINPNGVSFTIGSNGTCSSCSFNLDAWAVKDTICETGYGSLFSNEPGGFWTTDNPNLIWLDAYDNYFPANGISSNGPTYNTANLFYTVTVNGETCTDTVPVVIVKNPALPQIIGPYQICGNTTANYSIIDVPGSQITWTNNQFGSIVRNGNTLTLTTFGTANGYIRVDYSNSNNYCKAVSGMLITINPTATFTEYYSSYCDNYDVDIITIYPNATFTLSNPNAGYIYTYPAGNIVRVIKNNGFNGTITLTQTVIFPGGCTSTYSKDIHFYTTRHDTTMVSICPNQLPYVWQNLPYNGTAQTQTITTAGTYYYSYIDYSQCTVFQVLIVNVTNPNSTTNTSICSNQLPYTWNNQSYTTAGSYTVHLTNVNGCDSAATLNLTVNNGIALKDTIRLSNCGNVYYNGINYNTSTTLRDTFRTAAGCDSLYRVIYITIPSIPNASITNASNVSLGTTLNLSNASTAKQIDWYNNGVKVSTVHHASNITPTIVAGGNGYGNANNQVAYPYSIALDATGNLYTVNTHFNSVEKWDMATNTKTIVAGSGNQNVYGNGLGQLNQPRGIFVDNNYNVYVADGENHRVVKWAPSASSGVLVAGGNGGWNNADQLNYPSAVFVDAAGNIFIADEFNNRIQKWTPNAISGVTVAGNFHFGSPVINATELNHPAGVFVKPNGDIYVADMFNNRVQKFAAGSSVATTVAGQADGSAGSDACHLHFPHALYVDANDNVFVADGYNNRVQKWTPNATSGITVAGGEGNSFTNGIEALTMNSNGDMFCGSVVISSVTKWVNPNPTIDTTFTPTTTGNYYSVLTFDNCCQLTTNAVTVASLNPLKPITGNKTICSIGGNTTLSTTFSTTTNNFTGKWTNSNPSVAKLFGAVIGLNTSKENKASVNIESIAPGTTTISYTLNLSGVISTVSTTVIVDPVTVAPIVGKSTLCVGSTTQLSATPSGGIWSSLNNAATIDNTGLLKGTFGGGTVPAIIKYSVTNASGCTAFVTYNVVVNPIPRVPTIQYAPGTPDPQYGAPSGSFCANKTFTVVGNPAGGAWSKTGVILITTTGGLLSTGNVAGNFTVTYTYTDANGCSNSRTVASNIVICAGHRGGNGITNNEQKILNNEFTMYPNPAHLTVSLQVEKLVGSGTIVVTDLYGKQVKVQALSMGTNTIDVSNLAKGFYLVSTITEQEKTTKKLLVE